MKRIIVCQKSVIEKIPLNEIYSYSNLNSETIIAYVTNSGTGLGVSCSISSERGHISYGFKYHKDLVMGRRSREKLQYVSNTKICSLELVLKAGRELLVFDDFREFLNYSIGHCKL